PQPVAERASRRLRRAGPGPAAARAPGVRPHLRPEQESRMTVLPVDIDVLREEIQKTYTDVSTTPGQEFIFPTGRAWAEDLGYPRQLANVPEASVESFAGVANPFSLGE